MERDDRTVVEHDGERCHLVPGRIRFLSSRYIDLCMEPRPRPSSVCSCFGLVLLQAVCNSENVGIVFHSPSTLTKYYAVYNLNRFDAMLRTSQAAASMVTIVLFLQ